MAAPQPMVRPDFYGVRKQNQGEISVFLPRASEEYGPISHYYVIVIPNSNSSAVRYPDQYNTEDLVAYSKSKIFFLTIFASFLPIRGTSRTQIDAFQTNIFSFSSQKPFIFGILR